MLIHPYQIIYGSTDLSSLGKSIEVGLCRGLITPYLINLIKHDYSHFVYRIKPGFWLFIRALLYSFSFLDGGAYVPFFLNLPLSKNTAQRLFIMNDTYRVQSMIDCILYVYLTQENENLSAG